jgi:hypothetical protein
MFLGIETCVAKAYSVLTKTVLLTVDKQKEFITNLALKSLEVNEDIFPSF